MFDRFNICTAYYVYALECHSGQFSKAYKILGRLNKIEFQSSVHSYDDLDESEKMIYDGLVSANY